ncbi:fructosamine/ketosamine-3-kinase [Apiospora marii]|uniref:fructosamine/ketosamine-3-kinase n=1 Tax=Apiospora marii TaxID=335849 RepID=UPI0031308F2F
MVQIGTDFESATIPEEWAYEGPDADPNVLALLPKGCRVVWVTTRGASFWAVNYKITVQAVGKDAEKVYFMKIFLHERGHEMVEAEYESTKAWHDIVPDNVAKPIGWGELADRPGRWFLLLEFRDMTDKMPPASEFVQVVARGHQASASPTGRFGFHLTTFAGNQANDNSWCDTWEEWFTRAMKCTMENEIQIQGPHPELQALSEKILTKVIPRLLRPMETNGRKIKPSLVHGDLWHGNVGVDNGTGVPVIYDCGSFYGHNEFDLSCWRAARYQTNRSHVEAYLRVAEKTEPADDFEDRFALYTAALDEFRKLVEKYSGGYEEYQRGQTSAEIANL